MTILACLEQGPGGDCMRFAPWFTGVAASPDPMVGV